MKDLKLTKEKWIFIIGVVAFMGVIDMFNLPELMPLFLKAFLVVISSMIVVYDGFWDYEEQSYAKKEECVYADYRNEYEKEDNNKYNRRQI